MMELQWDGRDHKTMDAGQIGKAVVGIASKV